VIDDYADNPPALGSVIETERGSLPFALIHGEALVAAAAWSLGESGVTPVDFSTTWAAIQEAGEPFVLHDSLCPMTPPAFLAHCVELAEERGAVVVGVRPVTDTVKTVTDGLVGETLDRTALLAVASPIVLPVEVVAALEALPTTDFAALAEELSRRFPVLTVEAPAEGRRVATPEEVRLLEALTLPTGS
jgi:2-C-methyl-D-erythritol 4-phosphate cytidylyltransferase